MASKKGRTQKAKRSSIGRPPEPDPLTGKVSYRLKQSHHETLKQRAAARGCTPHMMAREIAVAALEGKQTRVRKGANQGSVKLDDKTYHALRKFTVELVRQGRNLNQIRAAMNMRQHIGLQELSERLDKIEGALLQPIVGDVRKLLNGVLISGVGDDR